MFLSVLPANHIYHIFHIFYYVQSVVATTYILIFFYFFLQCFKSWTLSHLSLMLYLVWKMAQLGPALCVMLDKMPLSQLEPLIVMVYCSAPPACWALFATTYIQVTVELRTLHCCVPTPHIGDTIMNQWCVSHRRLRVGGACVCACNWPWVTDSSQQRLAIMGPTVLSLWRLTKESWMNSNL